MSAYDRLQKSLEYMYNYIIPDLYQQIEKAKHGSSGNLKLQCDFNNCQCTFDGMVNSPDELQKHITVQVFMEMLTELLTGFQSGMEDYVNEKFEEVAAGEGLVTTQALNERIGALEGDLETTVQNAVEQKIGNVDLTDICTRSHVDAEMESVNDKFNNLQNQYVDYQTYNPLVSEYMDRTNYLLIKLREIDPNGRFEWSQIVEYKQEGKI